MTTNKVTPGGFEEVLDDNTFVNGGQELGNGDIEVFLNWTKFKPAILSAHTEAVIAVLATLKAEIRGEGEPGNSGEMIAVNEVDRHIDSTIQQLRGEK